MTEAETGHTAGHKCRAVSSPAVLCLYDQSLSFDYETQLRIEQAGKIVTDTHLTDLTKTVLTPYKSGQITARSFTGDPGEP